MSQQGDVVHLNTLGCKRLKSSCARSASLPAHLSPRVESSSPRPRVNFTSSEAKAESTDLTSSCNSSTQRGIRLLARHREGIEEALRSTGLRRLTLGKLAVSPGRENRVKLYGCENFNNVDKT